MKNIKIKLEKTYHFVVTLEMKKKIEVFSDYQGWNISESMMYIIKKMMPVIDYYYYFDKETTDFYYYEIEADAEIKFKIERDIYRKLKNVQGSIHSFSVAVLIRKMIDVFFKYLMKGKLECLYKVLRRRIVRRINRLMHYTKHWNKKHYEVHMYDDDTNIGYLKCIYSKNFTLLGFEKINNLI